MDTRGGGVKLIWSGNEYEHKEGVGFLLNNSAKQALLGYKPINSRFSCTIRRQAIQYIS